MDYDDWEPVYAAIRADFGFDRGADERARDVFDALLGDSLSEDHLSFLDGAAVAIVAPGPSLHSALADGASDDGPAGIATADRVVAVSDAAVALREHDVAVDCHVTDLDGAPLVTRQLSKEGVPVAIHAHGDNVPALRRHVPCLDHDRVYPTAQVEPAGRVQAPGGFTDGDRAAVIADRCGASELRFVGWDLEDRSVGPIKRRKLRWAARILAWLETRRDERYAPLDGLRTSLEPVPFE
jgi:uncharacterized Rossmann fold enzyme